MHNTRVMKFTEDDWHSSYELKGYYRGTPDPRMVEVSLLSLTDGKTRVCVWGNDDFGLERDFTDAQDAMFCFATVIGKDIVSIGYLRTIGFENA